MIGSFSNKLIVAIGIVMAILWTLAMALVYGLIAATDDAWHWLNGLISIPPEFAAWLSAAGTWLAQFGGWLLLVVWALGIVIVLLLALFARRLANLIPHLVAMDDSSIDSPHNASWREQGTPGEITSPA